jgi:hypothetical protein
MEMALLTGPESNGGQRTVFADLLGPHQLPSEATGNVA